MTERLVPARWTCALAAVLASAAAFASPTTKPAEHSAKETIQVLVAQGGAALVAHDSTAALDAYLDAQQLLKTDPSITAADPLRVLTMQGVAASYLQDSKFEKASDYFKSGTLLDHELSSPAAPRSLLINRAVLDLNQKFNIMRVVKSCKDYLTAHPDPVDEEILNVLGTALDKAAQDDHYVKTPLFEQAAKLYQTATAKLEQTRPGEKRWGTTWIDQADYTEKNRARNRAMSDLTEAQRTLAQRASDAQAADANLQRLRSLLASGRFVDVRGAQEEQQRAAQAVAEAQADVAAKKQAVTPLPWLQSVDVAIPEMNSAPVFVAVAHPNPPTQAMNLPPGKETPTHNPAPANDNPPRQRQPAHNRFDSSSDNKSGATFGEEDNTPAPSNNSTPTPKNTPPTPQPTPQPIPKSVASAQVTRYATAFPVGPELFVTTQAAVNGASTISLDDPQGNTFTATFVRGDDKTGLALIRVPDKKFTYLALGDSFAGGEVQCSAFPTVAIFSPTPEVLAGHAGPIKPNDPKWLISFPKNPRLGGGPLTTSEGKIVGVEMTQRDSNPQQVPAVKLDDLKAFLAADAPKSAAPGADINYILMVTATVSK